MDDDVGAVRVAEDVASDVQVLPDDESLDGSELETAEGILDTKAVSARVEGDLVKVLLDEPVAIKLDPGTEGGGGTTHFFS